MNGDVRRGGSCSWAQGGLRSRPCTRPAAASTTSRTAGFRSSASRPTPPAGHGRSTSCGYETRPSRRTPPRRRRWRTWTRLCGTPQKGCSTLALAPPPLSPFPTTSLPLPHHLSPLAPPPRVYGEVYLALPHLRL